MNILLNRAHELRSGWKFAAYWMLFIILYIALMFALPFDPQTQWERLLLNTIIIVPVAGAFVLMVRLVDRVPFAAFGVTVHEGSTRDTLTGVGVSAGMLALLVVVSGVFGGVVMTWSASDVPAHTLIVTLLVLVISAAQEELLFRGYPMQVLIKGMGAWPAVLTMSTAFGVAHLLNPNATVLGAVNTVLAGVMLSVAYLKTRSLWLPYGLHLGWNVGLGFVLGYPLSGIPIDSLWKTAPDGPRWLFGGEYGPEGGLIGTVVFTGATLFIRSARVAEISPKIRTALAQVRS